MLDSACWWTGAIVLGTGASLGGIALVLILAWWLAEVIIRRAKWFDLLMAAVRVVVRERKAAKEKASEA